MVYVPSFSDDNSNEFIQMDLKFAALCRSLEESGYQNAEKYTVFKFNTVLNYFEDKRKQNTKK